MAARGPFLYVCKNSLYHKKINYLNVFAKKKKTGHAQ
jgi:hypothetical protein